MRPVGAIVQELGQIGHMSVEAQAILTDCCIISAPYSDDALASIPSLPFTIPESELAKRNDMRDTVTFTIDPSTAKGNYLFNSCIQRIAIKSITIVVFFFRFG